MAKTSRKAAPAKKRSAAKKKTAAPKRTAATKPKVASAQEEYAKIRARAIAIAKDYVSPDRDRAKQAATAWDRMNADLDAWSKKHGIKLKKGPIEPDALQGATVRAFGRNTHGCALVLGGTTPHGNTLNCCFTRYSHHRHDCLYACATFPPAE